MEKIAMRDYVEGLESRISAKLNLWKKESKIENGVAVQVEWQFEQSHIIVDIFWQDGDEALNVTCQNPHLPIRFSSFVGLNAESEAQLMDKIGNFAQIVQSLFHE